VTKQFIQLTKPRLKPRRFKVIFTRCFFVSILLVSKVFASDVNGIRFWQDPEKTRIVFDLSESAQYKIFTLSKPSRLVVDLNNSILKTTLSEIELPQSLVSEIRNSQSKNNLRIVIDLKKSVTTKDFTLKPFQKYGYRLVIDLKPTTSSHKQSKKRIIKTAKNAIKERNRNIVIAIDAGHGGEDPGAPGGEKGVTLAVAKQLYKMINKEKGMKAVLTRKGDYFVGLRKRTEIARKNKADLFISLHADGFPDKRVRGASVWVLSPKGANSEMGRWLEQKEQASDLAGGVDISHQDPLVAQVLLDLSMNYSVGESFKAGELVRKQLSKSMSKMHGKNIKKAAFVVLKMPDIPAMMVEMGFISNKTENRQLKSTKHQKRIAGSVFAGVKRYFRANPPEGSLYASLIKEGFKQSSTTNKKVVRTKSITKKINKKKSHKVRSGDTLSQIALVYGVSTSRLKKYNHLKNDRLRIGQMIKIPSA